MNDCLNAVKKNNHNSVENSIGQLQIIHGSQLSFYGNSLNELFPDICIS